MDLCQRLFRSFQNSEAAQEDRASEIRRRVLTGSTRALINQRRGSTAHPSPCLPQRKSFSRMSRVTSPSWRTDSRGTSWSVRPRAPRSVFFSARFDALALFLSSRFQALRQRRQRSAGQLRKFPLVWPQCAAQLHPDHLSSTGSGPDHCADDARRRLSGLGRFGAATGKTGARAEV